MMMKPILLSGNGIKAILLTFLCLCGIPKVQSQTNWELLNPKPTSLFGINIHFVSNNTGYIITRSELLETVNAGASWQKKQNIASGNDLNFYNATGFIVGNNGYVLKSIDSGTTWNQVSTGFNGNFNTVNLIDDATIIISSTNSIIKSIDAGATWESLSIPNSVVKRTFFVNALIGHAACKRGTMLKTIDGGLNWYYTQSTNTTPSDFFTVYFINENIGFSTREHNDLYKTIDGGETWEEIPNTNIAIYSFQFLDENTGYAAGDNGAILKTTDGGSTWTWVSFQDSQVYNTSMSDIYFLDNNVGYATGARGRIVKTTDGGNTWTPYAPTYNDIRKIEFPETNIGYVGEGNRLYKTMDNGNNWAYVSSIGESVYATDFVFLNENLGYATERLSGGHVFKTTDGGITWITLNGGNEIIEDKIYSIFFYDENIGFISGGVDPYELKRTIDGGITWEQVATKDYAQMQFLSPQIGFARRYKEIHKTIDGGYTWDVVYQDNSSNSSYINSLQFVNESIGYFVGDYGLMRKTFDDGANWLALDIPSGSFTLVNFYSANVGYIADDDGKLYKTMNGGASWEYLTTLSGIKSLEIVADDIFMAGENGKILKSTVEYDSIVLYVNPVENLTSENATLSGNVTSNAGLISNIQFEFSQDNSFSNPDVVVITPNIVPANESVNVSVDLTNLNQNTTYFFRLKGTYNSVDYTSQTLSFTTPPYYELTARIITRTADTAELEAIVTSNQNDLTNIEFQYGIQPDALDATVSLTPSLVTANTREVINGALSNLEPETIYYVRIKAVHEGSEVFGPTISFITFPEYELDLSYFDINENEITLFAYATSNSSQGISNIVFEYGTIYFENSIAADPDQIAGYGYGHVSATLTDLDPNRIYYYRVKAIQGTAGIYSEEGVFNTSGEIIMVCRKPVARDNNSFDFRGLINSNGTRLSNIQFEYGTTENFGSTIPGSPDHVSSYYSFSITATISDLLPNQEYYYRLVATDTDNETTLHSITYQFYTGTLPDEESSVILYPNPTKNTIHLLLERPENISSIVLADLSGKVIQSYKNQNFSNLFETDLSGLPLGVYLLNITYNNKKIRTEKILLR